MSQLPTNMPGASPYIAQGRFSRVQLLAYAGLAALFVLIFVFTKSTHKGDTMFYVIDVVKVLKGEALFSSLIEFAHLIWRPIGFFLTPGEGGPGSLSARTTSALVAVNFVASGLCVAGLWVLLRMVNGVRITGAFAGCAVFIFTNGFINFSRSGSSWLPGLACLLFATIFSAQAGVSVQTGRRSQWKWILPAASLVALSVLLWVPYVFSALPAALAWLLVTKDLRNTSQSDIRKLVRQSAIILLIAGTVVVCVYGMAIFYRQISSVGELQAWIRQASHGEQGDRQLLRLVFGLPRSFLILGDDGVLWKQFLFHDPYAGVTIADVAAASLWRIALFYLMLATVALELLWHAAGRSLLFWSLTSILPTILLAVLFEAGSAERYLALYPAVLAMLAFVISQPGTQRWKRLLIFAFCLVLIGNNLASNAAARIDSQKSRAMARVANLNSRAAAYTLNIRDELSGAFLTMETDRTSQPDIQMLMPPIGTDVPIWKVQFGKTLLQRWERGGEVWVTRRAWAAKPDRNWLWVEGDDRRVHWRDVGAVVTKLSTDAETGGRDGFLRIADTPANRSQAQALIGQGAIR